MKKRRSRSYIVLSLVFLGILLLALSWGTYQISLSDIYKTIMGKGNLLQSTTIWDIRMPRIGIALLVGICLAASGSVLQTVTGNELAEPGMIGINAGAALMVVLVISNKTTNYYDAIGASALYIMPVVAIFGACMSGIAIYLLSYKRGVSPTRLILTGIGVNVGINAFISLYQLNMSRGDYNQVLTWTSGSLWGSSWRFFWLILPGVMVFLVAILHKAKILDVLSLGDEIATGLGVQVEKERRILFFFAIVLAALATSVAGNIAFLGLLGPHIAKRLVGPVHRRQIPLAALISSMIMIFADTFSRNMFSPIEIPAGIMISIVGVPYFIYLMMKEA
ncbi:FecCD family ABC transporter permease [Anaerosporobacter faecicola]|uniref:FecCD family ABC transporter permease n=1 Tax=Anaerosporobacter faecicola TaxID=2718714 RepID=UPI001438D19E|nr:iron ABC transporter permease [Anaerosporobacter faecicola]